MLRTADVKSHHRHDPITPGASHAVMAIDQIEMAWGDFDEENWASQVAEELAEARRRDHRSDQRSPESGLRPDADQKRSDYPAA